LATCGIGAGCTCGTWGAWGAWGAIGYEVGLICGAGCDIEACIGAGALDWVELGGLI
jgi:hypothetical protein